MGLDARQLRLFVVRPVLRYLDPAWRYSLAAENLLLGTAATESQGLRYLDQVTHAQDATPGPARGLWQIEPATLKDIVGRYLQKPRHRERYTRVINLSAVEPSLDEQLASNLAFACAIARVRYAMAPAPLPAADDIAGLADYWKRHFNGGGKGTPAAFGLHYRTTVAGSEA